MTALRMRTQATHAPRKRNGHYNGNLPSECPKIILEILSIKHTREELCSKISGYSKRTVQIYLERLVSEGKIVRIMNHTDLRKHYYRVKRECNE